MYWEKFSFKYLADVSTLHLQHNTMHASTCVIELLCEFSLSVLICSLPAWQNMYQSDCYCAAAAAAAAAATSTTTTSTTITTLCLKKTSHLYNFL